MKYAIVALIIAAFFLQLPLAFAQEESEEKADTTTVVEDTLQLQQGAVGINKPGTEAPDTVVIESMSRRVPRRAALYSAVLPGLGQAYNGKYWKIPIIYGGLITMGYLIILNDDRYRLFLRANEAVRNQEPNPLAGLRGGRYDSSDQLTRFVENARRDRDFMVILTAGLYALNIMDAIADAHLIEFDINPDLSMDFKPMAGSALAYYDHLTPTIPTYGFSFTVSLY
ncbi:MAG: DUF5683 domain-containing protein [Bacteroidota bacterium]